MMLEGAGFKVIDLGVDVAPDKLVEAVRQNQAELVGLSALLSTTMPAMGEAVAHLKDQGLEAKVMVGGAPVTQEFADQVGAHGYAEDAPAAVALARSLL
jgi:5-methyltetrahydrofolate--homocysteine methyltransferase